MKRVSNIRRVALQVSALMLAASTAVQLTNADGASSSHWPQFRGAGATGVADGSSTPTEWDVASNKGIAWKTAVPGLSHSSPIVWGDRVFVTTAVSGKDNQSLKVGLFGAGDSADDMTEHAWKLYCLDRRDGKILWERTATSGVPKVKRHVKATHDNCTPAADATRVAAFFGSEGLYCYDHDGELKWKKDLGVLDVGPHNGMELQWGFASSPILVDGRVIVQCDAKGEQFLAAFDASDGREIWRTRRDDVPNWCTPNVISKPAGGGTNGDAGTKTARQIICNGCKHIAGYDFDTGKELWRMSGGGGIPVPTPVAAGELVVLTSNHRPIRESDPQKPVYALRPWAATGDVSLKGEEKSNSAVVWMKAGRGCYMQTPLVYRGLLYICEDNGVLTCYDAATGEQKFRERLTKDRLGFTASGVAADGKLYYTSEEGDVFVLDAGAEFKVIAQNKLSETCLATPAITDGWLIFHTRGHVIAVGK